MTTDNTNTTDAPERDEALETLLNGGVEGITKEEFIAFRLALNMRLARIESALNIPAGEVDHG